MRENFCGGVANGLSQGRGRRTGAEADRVIDYYRDASRAEALESSPAIQVGVKAGPDADEARWTFFLTVFFRVMSLLWIVEGLAQWRRVLAPVSGSFLDHTSSVMAATIFFAVLDLVAAVGLWLVAPWGGVVWILTLVAQVFVASVKPAFFFGGGWIKLFDAILLAAYLALSWRANIAAGDIGPAERLIESIRGLIRSRRAR